MTLDVRGLEPEQGKMVHREILGSITDPAALDRILAEFDIDHVYHLAAYLSTRSEFTPVTAHQVNVEGTMNLLEFAQKQAESHGRPVVFLYPSSIAAYGLPDLETKAKSGRVREEEFNTPTTMYGCNKLYCELLGRYYARHYKQLAAEPLAGKVDFRAVRFPGLISAVTVPSGGTSDYAPEMIHAAAKGEAYACFVRPDTRIPFMAMPDGVEVLLKLAAAPRERLTKTAYNVGAFNPSADEFRAGRPRDLPGGRHHLQERREAPGHRRLVARGRERLGGEGRLGLRAAVRLPARDGGVPDPDDPAALRDVTAVRRRSHPHGSEVAHPTRPRRRAGRPPAARRACGQRAQRRDRRGRRRHRRRAHRRPRRLRGPRDDRPRRRVRRARASSTPTSTSRARWCPPSEFARAVVPRGTTTVITDPHEIANVLGLEGIRFMFESAKYGPLGMYVMASSCVPATAMSTNGAVLHGYDLFPLKSDPWVLGLAEVMNYPGVIAGDDAVLEKIGAFQDRVIDGHSPALERRGLQTYVAAGVQSDHESTTAAEALEKLRLGMMVMIREGTVARDLAALVPLVSPANQHRFCFCTDDCQPADLVERGGIDHAVRKAIALGMDPVTAIRLATWNPAQHFRLHQRRRHHARPPGRPRRVRRPAGAARPDGVPQRRAGGARRPDGRAAAAAGPRRCAAR